MSATLAHSQGKKKTVAPISPCTPRWGCSGTSSKETAWQAALLKKSAGDLVMWCVPNWPPGR